MTRMMITVAAASAALLLSFLILACAPEGDDDDDVADPECEPLVAAIYDDCGLRLPAIGDDGRPGRDRAVADCKYHDVYDWACIDECVFDYKNLCSTLSLCLDDCV